jgi:hypothetical protein
MLLLSSFGATIACRGAVGRRRAPRRPCDGALNRREVGIRTASSGAIRRSSSNTKGSWCPLGHPATLVKETERRLIPDPKLGVIARLVHRFLHTGIRADSTRPVPQSAFRGARLAVWRHHDGGLRLAGPGRSGPQRVSDRFETRSAGVSGRPSTIRPRKRRSLSSSHSRTRRPGSSRERPSSSSTTRSPTARSSSKSSCDSIAPTWRFTRDAPVTTQNQQEIPGPRGQRAHPVRARAEAGGDELQGGLVPSSTWTSRDRHASNRSRHPNGAPLPRYPTPAATARPRRRLP